MLLNPVQDYDYGYRQGRLKILSTYLRRYNSKGVLLSCWFEFQRLCVVVFSNCVRIGPGAEKHSEAFGTNKKAL